MSDNNALDIGVSKYSRDKTIEHLKYSFTHDFLDEGDFEKRVKIALETRSRNELQVLVDDLPEYKDETNDNQAQTPSVEINKGNIKDKLLVVSVLGGAERKGMWKPAKHIDVINVLGGTDLDFSQAIFPPGITEINLVCVLGGVDIIVPLGINIDNQCIAVLGGVDNENIQTENENNPTLRIKGVCVLGGVDIKTPKEGLMKRILTKLGID